jgi:excisionase family DNA binding protein
MQLPDDLILKTPGLRDQYFDLKGLAVYSSMSVSTLRDHIRVNGLPAYEVRGKILIKRSEFDAWISRYRMNRSQDLDKLADEVISEIGCLTRRSQRIS